MHQKMCVLLICGILSFVIACGDEENNQQQSSNQTAQCTPPQMRDPITNMCFTPKTTNKQSNNKQNNLNNDPFGDCPVEARPIYTVDSSNKLLRFEPRDEKFTEIGTLRCPARQGATPFSMSVDRKATAWVLYSSGEIFWVSTRDASCQPSGFQVGQSGFEVFGMGFVLTEPGSTKDILYVAGGRAGQISEGTANLGTISEVGLKVTPVDRLSGWPELTGTANGDLWGFFPGTSPPKVTKISRLDGSESNTFPITAITGQPNAWAFAFWGGDFYLFYKSQEDPSSRVFKLKSSDGTVQEILTNTGYFIVGAGVSTCAPVINL